MLEATMFNPLVGDSFVTTLTSDLIIIIPIALVVMATLWGVRLALKYFKGIAR
jgi:hypothetical protein